MGDSDVWGLKAAISCMRSLFRTTGSTEGPWIHDLVSINTWTNSITSVHTFAVLIILAIFIRVWVPRAPLAVSRTLWLEALHLRTLVISTLSPFPTPICRRRRTSLSSTSSKVFSPSSFPYLLQPRRFHPQHQSPLFARLPPELRHHIFTLALGGHRFHIEYTVDATSRPAPRIRLAECLGSPALPCPPVSPRAYRSQRTPLDWRAEQRRIVSGERRAHDLRAHRWCTVPWAVRRPQHLALLRTCRAAYVEARAVLYGANVFAVDRPLHLGLWARGVPVGALELVRRVEVCGGSGARGWEGVREVLEEMRGLREVTVVLGLDGGGEAGEGGALGKMGGRVRWERFEERKRWVDDAAADATALDAAQAVVDADGTLDAGAWWEEDDDELDLVVMDG